MIFDHRPDTLTPVLKEIGDLRSALPDLFARGRAGDPRLGLLMRHALRDVHHYHCPLGLRIGDAWLFVIAEKLQSPNKTMASWMLQQSARKKWQRLLEPAIAKAEGAASFNWLRQLGRQPRCAEKMALQIVRLVASSREFIKDDDNLAFSRKQASDAMKHLGLLKDDRREWLDALPIYQDVAPHGRALTVFMLWPTAAGLFTATE